MTKQEILEAIFLKNETRFAIHNRNVIIVHKFFENFFNEDERLRGLLKTIEFDKKWKSNKNRFHLFYRNDIISLLQEALKTITDIDFINYIKSGEIRNFNLNNYLYLEKNNLLHVIKLLCCIKENIIYHIKIEGKLILELENSSGTHIYYCPEINRWFDNPDCIAEYIVALETIETTKKPLIVPYH